MEKNNQSGPLTDREWQVIKLSGKGYRAKEIASELGITPSTARTHIRNVYEKTECKSVAQVIYKILTTQHVTAVESFCEENQCEMLQWIDVEKIKDLGHAERCLLKYEAAVLEATHIGNSIFVGNGQIMPKPVKVAKYPKGPNPAKTGGG